jgi:hypothetical protein
MVIEVTAILVERQVGYRSKRVPRGLESPPDTSRSKEVACEFTLALRAP